MAHVTKRKKAEVDDGMQLGTLRWWALTIEKTSMEVLTTNPKHFLAIRKILATAVSEINALVHDRPKAEHIAAAKQKRSAAAAAPQMMSEGITCDVDADCGDPDLECCDGICVPRNACNIA